MRSRGKVRHRAAASPPVLRESVLVIGLALVFALIIKTWLMQAFFIPWMSPWLRTGGRVPPAQARGADICFAPRSEA